MSMHCPIALLLSVGLVHAADLRRNIEALVRQELDRQKIPALSVAILQNNKVAFSIDVGWADLEQRVPASANSIHRLASLSKPVTATLVLKLVEQGRMALDDSVRKYLPDLPERYGPVTVRRLLCHQSGIREYADLNEVFSTKHYLDLKSALSIFIDSPLLYPPGSKVAYTTYGYTLLGAVLEQVTGKNFAQIVQANLRGFLAPAD